jgi:hypothetical protein
MVMYNLFSYSNNIFNFLLLKNIINMPCDIFYYAMCHNFGPSLIVIMDDGDQYFEKNNFMAKIIIMPRVRFQ